MIKIRLEKWEKAIVMQVLEMEEALREKKEIHEFNGFLLCSYDYPSLTDEEKGICLRGFESDYDFDVSSITFDTNNERDEYYQKIIEVCK